MRWLLLVLALTALSGLLYHPEPAAPPLEVCAAGSARFPARPHRPGHCDRCGLRLKQMRVAPVPRWATVVCYQWYCPACVRQAPAG